MPRVPSKKVSFQGDLLVPVATAVVSSLLQAQGSFTQVPGQTEDIPLKSYNPTSGRTLSHDIAVKGNWVGDWPSLWDVIHIPTSKEWLTVVYDPVKFWVVNSKFTEAYCVDGHKAVRFRKWTSKPPDSKQYFCVPLKECSLVKLYNTHAPPIGLSTSARNPFENPKKAKNGLSQEKTTQKLYKQGTLVQFVDRTKNDIFTKVLAAG